MKILYYITTGLLTVIMLFSSSMYIFMNANIQVAYTTLGFPTYIIYPLAIAKLLGLVVLWFVSNRSLKEWAYAGFFFNLLLAVSAHVNINDGEFIPSLVGIILVLTSYFSWKKISIR